MGPNSQGCGSTVSVWPPMLATRVQNLNNRFHHALHLLGSGTFGWTEVHAHMIIIDVQLQVWRRYQVLERSRNRGVCCVNVRLPAYISLNGWPAGIHEERCLKPLIRFVISIQSLFLSLSYGYFTTSILHLNFDCSFLFAICNKSAVLISDMNSSNLNSSFPGI